MATITERAAAAVDTLRDETAMQARRSPDDRALARRRVIVATMDAISLWGEYPERLRVEALGHLALAERTHVALAIDGCDWSIATDSGRAELEAFRARLCELRGECGQLASVVLRAYATVDGALTRADAVAIVDAALAFDPSGECLASIVAAFAEPTVRERRAA